MPYMPEDLVLRILRAMLATVYAPVRATQCRETEVEKTA